MAMSVAVRMSVIVGMGVIHGQMLYYNITEVHAVAWSQIGALAALIARVLRRFRPQGRAQATLKGGRRRPQGGAGDPKEGAGKTGCTLHPRSRVQGVEKDAHEHTGSAEAVRPSLRGGFNGFLRALPGDRPSCHRRPQEACFSRTWRQHRGARTTRLRRPQSITLVSRGDRVHRIPPRVS
jgi:hypothetical protein